MDINAVTRSCAPELAWTSFRVYIKFPVNFRLMLLVTIVLCSWLVTVAHAQELSPATYVRIQMSSRIAEYNKAFELKAILEPQPGPEFLVEYNWMLNGRRMEIPKTQTVFRISAFQPSNLGLYQVGVLIRRRGKYYASYADSAIPQMLSDVESHFSFLKKTPIIQKLRGESFSFETHNNPRFNLKYMQAYYNDEISSNFKFREFGIHVDTEHGKIEFRSVTSNLTGQWRFEFFGGVSYTVNLVIFEKPKFVKIGEFILVKRVGDNVEIHCHADSIKLSATNQFRWYKKNSRMEDVPISSDWKVENEQIGMSHIRKSMVLGDQGEYVCKATDRVTGKVYQSRAWIYLNSKSVCGPGQIPCSDGACIHPNRLCDGIRHCSDDESPVRCAACDPIKRSCKTPGNSYNVFWRCDGENDCPDKYDESTCGSTAYERKCAPTHFKCRNNNQRIAQSFRCDGEHDCVDGSDEFSCRKPLIDTGGQRKVTKVKRGSTVRFTCVVLGDPTPVVIWRLNWKCTYADIKSAPLEDKMRYRSEVIDYSPDCNRIKHQLTIENVQPKDTGIYNCQALSNIGNQLGPDEILQIE